MWNLSKIRKIRQHTQSFVHDIFQLLKSTAAACLTLGKVLCHGWLLRFSRNLRKTGFKIIPKTFTVRVDITDLTELTET